MYRGLTGYNQGILIVVVCWASCCNPIVTSEEGVAVRTFGWVMIWDRDIAVVGVKKSISSELIIYYLTPLVLGFIL